MYTSAQVQPTKTEKFKYFIRYFFV